MHPRTQHNKNVIFGNMHFPLYADTYSERVGEENILKLAKSIDDMFAGADGGEGDA